MTPRRTELIRERAVEASIVLVVASVLWQRPLLQVTSGSGAASYVRPWDIAWLLFGAACVVYLSSRYAEAVRNAVTGISAVYWLFVASAALSLVWAYVNFGTDGFVPSVVRLLRLIAVGLLASTVALLCADDLRRRRRLGFVILAVAVIGGLLAIVGWTTSGNDVEGGSVTRAGGPFGNFRADGTGDAWWAQAAGANYLGFWLAVGLAIGVGWLTRPGSGERRPRVATTCVGVGCLVLVVGLLATHSRESWVAAVFGLLCVVWFQHRPPLKSRQTGLIIVACTLPLLVTLAVPSLRTRVFDTFRPGTFSYNSGPQARFEAWEAGLEWAWDRFPIGWGLGAIEEHPAAFGGATAENTLLQVFAQLGLPGLLSLAALLALGVAGSLRQLTREPSDAGLIFAAAFWAIVCVHGIFGNTLGDPTVLVLLGCALGILTAGLRRTSSRLPG